MHKYNLFPVSLSIGMLLLGLSTASIAGEFIPRLSPENPSGLPAGENVNGVQRGLIIPGGQGFKYLGETSFAETTLRVFGRSETTTSTTGTFNFQATQFGFSAIDNPVFIETFMDCPMANNDHLAAVYVLAVKELGPDGRGSVELDFRFSAPVSDLHLVVFDIDEHSGGRRESLLVSAYSANSPSIANKVKATAWNVIAQGDLSIGIDEPRGVTKLTLPPSWYAINVDPNNPDNSFGVLQARSRLPFETKSNQNRDFSVIASDTPIQQLRVNFRGPRPESNEIGAHTYIGLWHPDQACGYD